MEHCECSICKRSIRLAILTDKQDSEEDKKFLSEIHALLLDNEFEVSLLQLKVEELREKLKQ
jgi:hypothetical protein